MWLRLADLLVCYYILGEGIVSANIWNISLKMHCPIQYIGTWCVDLKLSSNMWISMCDQVCSFTFLLLLYNMGAFCGKCHCCYSFILLSVKWRGLGFTLVNLVHVSIGLHDLLCWDCLLNCYTFETKLGMIVQYQNHGQGRSEGSPPPKILHLLYVYSNWRTVCNLVCWHINMSHVCDQAECLDQCLRSRSYSGFKSSEKLLFLRCFYCWTICS